MEDIHLPLSGHDWHFSAFLLYVLQEGRIYIKVLTSRAKVDLSSSFGPVAAPAGHTAPSVSPLQSRQGNNHYLVYNNSR